MSTPPPTHIRATSAATAQAETGIDEVMITSLVHAFYARIRRDDVLGPVFAARVGNWDDHLVTMCQFWSSVLLMSGTYHGEPMKRHAPLPVTGAHFDRWLEIFRATATDVCPPTAASAFIDRAGRIAKSLEMGIAVSRGTLLRRDERLGNAA